MAVFVTDSACDYPEEWLEKHPMRFIGMKIGINNEYYTDGVDISREEFYNRITEKDDLKTAFPSVGEIESFYQKLREEGVKEVAAVHFSEKLSGFLNTYRLVVGKFVDMKVYIFDTRNASIGAGFVGMRLRELFESGVTLTELRQRLDDIRKRTMLLFSVTTLKYLQKNGKIGKAAGLLGSLLKIHPVLTIDEDGEVNKYTVCRGIKKTIASMTEAIRKFVKDKRWVRIAVGRGSDKMLEIMEQLKEKVQSALPSSIERLEFFRINRISPTVICHSGPEVFGVAVYAE